MNKIAAIIGCSGCIGILFLFPSSASATSQIPMTFGAFNEKRGDMTMAEFVPSDESLNNWSRLVCMQGFKGLADDVEPEQFLNSMADTYRQHCQGQVIYQQLGSSKVDGLEAVHGLLGCTSMPNIHSASAVIETILMMSILFINLFVPTYLLLIPHLSLSIIIVSS